jgi:hypothetical protein
MKEHAVLLPGVENCTGHRSGFSRACDNIHEHPCHRKSSVNAYRNCFVIHLSLRLDRAVNWLRHVSCQWCGFFRLYQQILLGGFLYLACNCELVGAIPSRRDALRLAVSSFTQNITKS